MPHTLLPYRVAPARMLRALRDEPGLVALFGDWVDGGAGTDAVIGIRPTRVLGPEEDPFAVLGAGDSSAGPADVAGRAATAGPRPATGAASSGSDDDAPGAFRGGWIGYLGYQLARHLESLPPAPPHEGGLSAHHMAHYDNVLRHEATTDRWVCEALPGADPARIAATVTAVERALAVSAEPSSGASRGVSTDGSPDLMDRPLDQPSAEFPGASSDPAGEASLDSSPGQARGYRCGPFRANASGVQHAAAVRRALQHIRDGDIFQVNLCRALEADFHGDPLDLFCAGYEALRPRFAAFLRTADGAVASLSPELYVRRRGGIVLTSPIKGTAPAGTDPAALHASAKNRAENVMIVDLMRNDLSRACVPGSVLSPAVPRVEPHTGVHHLVADVHGTLRPGLDDADLLRATFPPGSCTGAPKIRAMEIVNALEPSARAVYTGGVGFVSPAAGSAFNVAIRTFEFSGSRVRLGVGGGIVADSEPEGEAFETLVKAAPLLDAVGARFAPELAAEWHALAAREAAPVRVPACVSPRAERGTTPLGAVLSEEAHRPPLDTSRGVFTTLLVREGAPVELGRHLARLGASVRECWAAELPAALRDEVLEHAARLDGPHRLRITVAPDTAGRGSQSPPAVHHEITSAPLNPPGSTPPQDPWTLVPFLLPGGMGAHKWADRRVLEHAPGQSSSVEDALLTDRDGTVLETGRANVFVVLDGVVVTPPADGRILPGTARARVLELLRAAGYEVQEREVALQECARATEVFVTNALRGARPVREIHGVGRWAAGPVARLVGEALAGGAAASSSGRGA